MKCILVAMMVLIGSQAAMAEVTLNGIFSDGMVLQRGKGTAVFGQAGAGEKVTVKVAGQAAAATADGQGRWVARLDLAEAGGPFEMTVGGAEGKTLTVKNVLIGEVWICSGQSNMQFGLKDASNGKEAIAAAHLPNLRMTRGQGWTVCDPSTAGQFSAVAFFFGKHLSEDLKVPVGLITFGVGGTPIETWTSKEALAAEPELKKAVLDTWAKNVADYPQAMEAYDKAPKDKKPAKPIGGDFEWAPGRLFEKFLAPIAGYGVKGAVWYQGESDAWGFSLAELYYKALPTMINDWRHSFGKDMTFIVIQLPDDPNVKSPAQPKEVYPWKLVQEAQLQATKMPNVGLAIALDLGEGDIHPKKKEPVGERVALVARALAYGEKINYSGPTYDTMKVEGNEVRVAFKHVGGGLVAKGGELQGFTIAGEDRHFVWANAKIEGGNVVVWSKEVAKPAAVRYCFTEGGAYNLYNAEGIPASPFRTDDWSINTPTKTVRSAVAVAQGKTAAPLADFTIVHSYRPSAYPTEAKFTYDQDNLYVSIRCVQAGKVTALGDKADDEKILNGDFVEVLLDPKLDHRNYVRITVNPKGLVLDAKYFNDSVDGAKWLNQNMLGGWRGMDKTWSSGATVKTAQREGGWTVEVGIPWKSLGVEGKAGVKMGVEMERFVAAEQENSEWITSGRDRNTGAMMPWPKMYHSPLRFGVMTLE